MTTAHRFYVPAGLVALPSSPDSPAVGDTYFDTTMKSIRTWDGATWVSSKSTDSYTKSESDARYVDTAGDAMVNILSM